MQQFSDMFLSQNQKSFLKIFPVFSKAKGDPDT